MFRRFFCFYGLTTGELPLYNGNSTINLKREAWIWENEAVKADGFYDGDGIHRVRFMPSFEGEYTFSLQADFLPQPL